MTIKEKYAYVFLIRKYLMYELLAIGGIIIVYFGGWLFLSGKSDELTAEWLMFPVTDFLQSVLCFFLLFFYNEFKYFIQNGGYFSISTGRALPAFARYAKDLPCNAPCVIANGAAIYDFNKDCYVETAFLDADIYDHVDALLARFPGLCFEIYHDDRRIHVLHPNDYTHNHEHLTRAKTEEVKDFREVDLPIIKLLFEEEKPLLEQVRDFIVSRDWGKRYELIFSSDHLLELTRRGATKGGMILKLAKLLGVARKDIYCIGDHNNDIPMLEVSEIGFAPENAIPEVKEWGAHIVCHCKDGALADVVEILDKRY